MTRDDRAIDMRNRTLELVNARGGPTPRKSRRTLTGSAAKGIAKRLRHHGFEPVAEPESFFVHGTEGPLKDGELERAAAWARALGDQVEDVERLAVGSH